MEPEWVFQKTRRIKNDHIKNPTRNNVFVRNEL